MKNSDSKNNMPDFFFNAAINWVILAPSGDREPPVKELSSFISALRSGANLTGGGACIFDALEATGSARGGHCGASCDGEIIINYDGQSQKSAFAWRAGEERIEIYAHSVRSLANAVADFIRAFGAEHDGSGWLLPAPVKGPLYRLSKKAHHSW